MMELLRRLLCGLCGDKEQELAREDERSSDWLQHPALAKYRPVRKLGEGGFSEVWLAEGRDTGRPVALKAVFLGRRDLTPEQRAILSSEAKYLRLVAHPNVVRLLEVVADAGSGVSVIAMEALTGGEVLRRLGALSAYSEGDAAAVFAQVATAVAYLHGLGLVHRDIKCENVLFARPLEHYRAKGKAPRVKLVDLGMAGVHRPRAPQRGCMGSPGFIAPEVVRGAPHTPAMDVYSMGVLLFVMLVGRKPWDDDDSATLRYAVRRIGDAPGLSDRRFRALTRDAQDLLRRTLSDLARERPTAEEVLSHPWLRRDPASAAARRLLSRQVQRRMCALADSRRLLGARRALLLMPSGSQSAAEAFHRAVAEARRLKEEASATAAAAAAAAGTAAAAGAVTAAAQQQRRQVAAGAAAAEVPTTTTSSGSSSSSNSSSRCLLAGTGAACSDDKMDSASEAEGQKKQLEKQQQQQQLEKQEQQRHPLLDKQLEHDSSGDPGGRTAASAASAAATAGGRKAARSSALAAAIAGASSRTSLADLAAAGEASVADLARVSLARQSRVGLAKKSVGAGGSSSRASQQQQQQQQEDEEQQQQQQQEQQQEDWGHHHHQGRRTSASVPCAKQPRNEAAALPDDGDDDNSGSLLLPIAALEHGISLPTALDPAARRAWARRVAVSCSPGALQLVAAADHARQDTLVMQGRLTTDDDDNNNNSSNAAVGQGAASSASPLGASMAFEGGTTPHSLGALGLGTRAGAADGERGAAGARRAQWTSTAAAAELLASFRQRRAAGPLLRPLSSAGRRSLERAAAMVAAAAAAAAAAGTPTTGLSPIATQQQQPQAHARSMQRPPRGGSSPGAFAAVANLPFASTASRDGSAGDSPRAGAARGLSSSSAAWRAPAAHPSADMDLDLLLDARDSGALGPCGSAAAGAGSAGGEAAAVAAATARGGGGWGGGDGGVHCAASTASLALQATGRGAVLRLDSAVSEEGYALPSGLTWLQQQLNHHQQHSQQQEEQAQHEPPPPAAATEENDDNEPRPLSADGTEALLGESEDAEDPFSPIIRLSAAAAAAALRRSLSLPQSDGEEAPAAALGAQCLRTVREAAAEEEEEAGCSSGHSAGSGCGDDGDGGVDGTDASRPAAAQRGAHHSRVPSQVDHWLGSDAATAAAAAVAADGVGASGSRPTTSVNKQPASAVNIWQRWGGRRKSGAGVAKAPGGSSSSGSGSGSSSDGNGDGDGDGDESSASAFCVGSFRGFGAAGPLMHRGGAAEEEGGEDEEEEEGERTGCSGRAGGRGCRRRSARLGLRAARCAAARSKGGRLALADAGSSGDAGASSSGDAGSVDGMLETAFSGLGAPPPSASRLGAGKQAVAAGAPGGGAACGGLPASSSAAAAAAPIITLHAVGGNVGRAPAASSDADDGDDDDEFDGPSALLA